MSKHMLGKLSTTMDMWSDLKKTPYMACTGHWLHGERVPSANGSGHVYKLTLRTDLLGFTCVPGHHDGKHLCAAFL
ncbi:hypothetical protein C8F01DRAFT_38450 [Mycena amicta]|nr:hypothetical protein C8F01DRAFT_38450 [Mycena amicta]